MYSAKIYVEEFIIIRVEGLKCSIALREIIIVIFFSFWDCGWWVSNIIVHYDLISIEGWIRQKQLYKIFSLLSFFIWLIDFLRWFLIFFESFGNILYVAFLSTLPLVLQLRGVLQLWYFL